MIKGEIKRTSYNKIERINLNEQEYQKRLHEIKKISGIVMIGKGSIVKSCPKRNAGSMN